jgi:hypothetical protein
VDCRVGEVGVCGVEVRVGDAGVCAGGGDVGVGVAGVCALGVTAFGDAGVCGAEVAWVGVERGVMAGVLDAVGEVGGEVGGEAVEAGEKGESGVVVVAGDVGADITCPLFEGVTPGVNLPGCGLENAGERSPDGSASVCGA